MYKILWFLEKCKKFLESKRMYFESKFQLRINFKKV